MAKSDKEGKASKKTTPAKSSGSSKAQDKSRQLTTDDHNPEDEIESLPISIKVSKGPKNKAEDDNDIEDLVEIEADEPATAENDDDEWDPDFDEFDLPKSKGGKKVTGTKKETKGDDEDDFKIDEEFKDMRSGSSKGFDDEDDDY